MTVIIMTDAADRGFHISDPTKPLTEAWALDGTDINYIELSSSSSYTSVIVYGSDPESIFDYEGYSGQGYFDWILYFTSVGSFGSTNLNEIEYLGGDDLSSSSIFMKVSGLSLNYVAGWQFDAVISDGLSAGDILFGDDSVTGTSFADVIYGFNGQDSLTGGNGGDTLNGGNGRDKLTGGSGSDTFLFALASQSSTGATSADIITDFLRGRDKIGLSGIDAFASSASNDTFVWNGTAAFKSTTKGEVRFEKFDNKGSNNDYTMVWIDNDRDKDVEMAIRLTGLHNLSASDFIL